MTIPFPLAKASVRKAFKLKTQHGELAKKKLVNLVPHARGPAAVELSGRRRAGLSEQSRR
jgi:hypothetical protein